MPRRAAKSWPGDSNEVIFLFVRNGKQKTPCINDRLLQTNQFSDSQLFTLLLLRSFVADKNPVSFLILYLSHDIQVLAQASGTRPFRIRPTRSTTFFKWVLQQNTEFLQKHVIINHKEIFEIVTTQQWLLD